MSDAPTLPSYSGGIQYHPNMNPFKAASLLMKVATKGVGSKKGKIQERGKGGGKSGMSKTTVKTITSISKK
jgi:hypothetical protein